MIQDWPKYDKYLVFAEDFRNREAVQSRGGVLVGCSVGNGIKPTAASSRVTFGGTNAIGNNVTQMTWVFRVRATDLQGQKILVTKNNASYTVNQWFFRISVTASGVAVYCFFANGSLADTANLGITGFAPIGEACFHVVYNGGLAAINRFQPYVNGVASSNGIGGTIPTRLLANTNPIGVFNAFDDTVQAPLSTVVLKSVRILSTAWTAQEVADDYAASTYGKVFGP